MYFKLPPEKLEKLLNYLSEKPWKEVAQLIVELTQLAKSNEKDAPRDNPSQPVSPDSKSKE